jgi:hypothetical protein
MAIRLQRVVELDRQGNPLRLRWNDQGTGNRQRENQARNCRND